MFIAFRPPTEAALFRFCRYQRFGHKPFLVFGKLNPGDRVLQERFDFGRIGGNFSASAQFGSRQPVLYRPSQPCPVNRRVLNERSGRSARKFNDVAHGDTADGMTHPWIWREHATLSVTDESRGRYGDPDNLACTAPRIVVNIARRRKISLHCTLRVFEPQNTRISPHR
jgi:hypothetical protein